MKQSTLQMPMLGLGTWKAKPGEVGRAIREAIDAGVRHFDCSPIYENEKEIGIALRDAIKIGDIRREELWITSKLWNNKHEASKVQSALYESLDDLQLYYLDLYLMHWPVVFRKVTFPVKNTRDEFYSLEEMPLEKTWKAMLKLRETGIIKHTGVSNFSISKIEQISAVGMQPEVNQIEVHPYFNQQELVDYCQKKGILVTAYKPLGGHNNHADPTREQIVPDLIDHPIVHSIAQDNQMTPAQVLITWLLGRGIAAIPKSVNSERIKSNFEAKEYSLTPAQMMELTILNKNYRYVDASVFCKGESPYTIEGIWS